MSTIHPPLVKAGEALPAKDEQSRIWREPGVIHYALVCVGALVLIYLVFEQRGLEWGLFPVLIGLVGIVTRWGSAPLLLLLALAAGLFVESNRWLIFGQGSWLRVADLTLCAAALAYIAAHYRLQSLTNHVFPPVRVPGSRATQSHRRPARLVAAAEVGALLLSVPAWAALALFCWNLLPTTSGLEAIPVPLWRVMVLCWLAALALFLTASFLDYAARARMTTDEASLFLQDIVWHETRGEQRRINRWLAWARRKHAPGLIPAYLLVLLFLAVLIGGILAVVLVVF